MAVGSLLLPPKAANTEDRNKSFELALFVLVKITKKIRKPTFLAYASLESESKAVTLKTSVIFFSNFVLIIHM